MRRFWARNVVEKTISPPNDLQIAQADPVEQAFDLGTGPELNLDTNLIIHSIGLFSNFADGLVFANPEERIRTRLTINACEFVNLTGTLTTTAGSKTLSGAGTAFTTELSDGDIILFGGAYHIIDGAPANDTTATLRNYAYIGVSESGQRCDIINGQGANKDIDIRQLNYMYDLSDFVLPISLTDTTPDAIVLIGTITTDNDNFTFLTKSVNTDFDGDNCFFSLGIDVEFTPENR